MVAVEVMAVFSDGVGDFYAGDDVVFSDEGLVFEDCGVVVERL